MFRRRKPEPTSSSASAPESSDASTGTSLFSQSLPPAPAETERPARPASAKEPQPSMNTPLVPSSQSQQAGSALRSGVPASQPLPSLRSTVPGPKREAEKRTMLVGRGMTISGLIHDAEKLVVEGVIETTLINTTELVVAAGGLYRGEADTEDADIAGTVDGVITVRGSLTVRSTGKLIGTARCRRLQVEDGGQISGQLEMLTDNAARLLSGPTSAEDPAF